MIEDVHDPTAAGNARAAAAADTAGPSEVDDVHEPTTPAGTVGIRDLVTIELPATAAYLAVQRTTTASLAARLDFTLDEIEDLRIAVDEACSLLLGTSPPDAVLSCAFELTGDGLEITVTAPGTRSVPKDSFAWNVLAALAGHVETRVESEGRQSIVLLKRRGTDT